MKTLHDIGCDPAENSVRFLSGIRLCSVFLLFFLATATPTQAQTCPNLSGSYTNKIILTVVGKFRGETQTQKFTNSDAITIIQTNGCKFKYNVTDPTGSSEDIAVTGTISGKNVQITSKAFHPRNMIVHQNSSSASGTIANGKIILTGSGFIKGSLGGDGIEIRTTLRSEISSSSLSAPTSNFGDQTVTATPGAPYSLCLTNSNISGLKPIFLQWYKNDAPIAGATNACLRFPLLRGSDSGKYTIKARNMIGTNTVGSVTLGVCTYTLGQYYFPASTNGGTNTVSISVTNPVSSSNVCSLDVSTTIATNSWLRLLTAGGTNTTSGEFSYFVEPNTSEQPRRGVITVGDQIHTVFQAGIFLPPSNIIGRTFYFTITNWNGTTASNTTFLIITDGSSDPRFKIISRSSELPEISEPYAYSRNSSTATWILDPTNNSTVIQLNFTNNASGHYTATGSNNHSGHFNFHSSKPDFDSDWLSDIFFQRYNGQLAGWGMEGTNFLGSYLLRGGTPVPSGWNVVGAADFDQDGWPDLTLQKASGELTVWLMRGVDFKRSVKLRDGLAFPAIRASSLADFNGDNSPDILFQRNTATNTQITLWLMNGTDFKTNVVLGPAGAGWQIAGTGDVDNDGFPDIVMKHSNRQVAVRYMVGTNFVYAPLLRNGTPATAGWDIRGIADFDLDGKTDLLWQNDSSSKPAIWRLDGTNFLGSASLRAVTSGWKIVGPQ